MDSLFLALANQQYCERDIMGRATSGRKLHTSLALYCIIPRSQYNGHVLAL